MTSLGKTWFLLLFIAMLAYAASQWITDDFRVLTAESARRLGVASHPVAAPSVPVRAASGTTLALDEMLSPPGGATIATFMYTRCSTICSAVGDTFQQLQARLARIPEGDRVHLLTISFDPAHDDALTLTRDLDRRHADLRRWQSVVVAKPADLSPLLQRFGVTVIDDGQGGFEHNAAILVFDSSAQLIAIVDTWDTDTALSLARTSVRAAPTLP